MGAIRKGRRLRFGRHQEIHHEISSKTKCVRIFILLKDRLTCWRNFISIFFSPHFTHVTMGIDCLAFAECPDDIFCALKTFKFLTTYCTNERLKWNGKLHELTVAAYTVIVQRSTRITVAVIVAMQMVRLMMVMVMTQTQIMVQMM